MNLFQYLFFCAFYFVVVFMQADVYNGYSVVSSVRRAVVPLDGEGYPVTTMSGPNQILDWLLASASPVWVDEVCGDGVCNSPFEFPAYGRFGCRADCGSNTNLTTMLLQVRADFRDDLYAPQALRAAASWNLCKRDEAATKAGFPDVCWWQEDRAFVKIVENHLETVNVPPDELWFVAVKGDYMGRVVGNVFIAENNSLPWVGTVPEWKACPRNVVSSRRNVAATSSARRMLLEVEKHADGAGASARDASARGEGERNRVTSHKRRAAPGETLETLVNADTTAGSRRKLLGGGVDVAASAIDWMDQRADDFVDFWTSRDAAPAPAPAAPVLSSTSAFENGISPSKTLTAKAETRVPERRSLLGDRDDAFRFDGATVGAAAAVYDTSNWGSTLTTKMTFEAWVKPALVGSNFNTTLVMSGDYDWGIMLVCGGGGSGCCGAHADGEYFPIPTFRLCDWPYETDTFLLISGAVAFFTSRLSWTSTLRLFLFTSTANPLGRTRPSKCRAACSQAGFRIRSSLGVRTPRALRAGPAGVSLVRWTTCACTTTLSRLPQLQPGIGTKPLRCSATDNTPTRQTRLRGTTPETRLKRTARYASLTPLFFLLLVLMTSCSPPPFRINLRWRFSATAGRCRWISA